MKISVITVNRNNASGLRKTIESVISQTVSPYEFIIIDGASTDGGADLLGEYSNYITFSVSEPDKGIYNAMNKGIAQAHGDYCIFMNSGDCFCDPDVLAGVNGSGATADIICGNAIIMEENPRRKPAPKDITMRTLFDGSLCHQSVFIRTSLLAAHPYDESLRIVADRKFFLQSLILDSCTYEAMDVDIVNYDVSGLSANNRFASEQEWQDVLKVIIPERVLLDYGRNTYGPVYGVSNYDRLFTEIRQRKWQSPVYGLVLAFLRCIGVFIKSARFARSFPLKINS